MIRRRAGEPEESSSSDEEDAFSVLSKKTSKKRGVAGSAKETAGEGKGDGSQPLNSTKMPVAITSSMRRHHHTTNTRKAKMDALLIEVEADKKYLETSGSSGASRDRFAPSKKGSYCESTEEEMLTTNVFVGNLDPSITEEEVTEEFRQFGDLYSVKIMWPRTYEERARNRNTGFVCFMKREDAEDAVDALNEADPFNVGRRLMLRWGKNVKKKVRAGTGGVVPAFRKKASEESMPPDELYKRRKLDDGIKLPTGQPSTSQISRSLLPKYDPNINGKHAIRVVAPDDPRRLQFITTVASFVAKDGSIFERTLIERESLSPDFAFLTMEKSNQSDRPNSEHIFYRWRVFAFCQGDGFDSWRTEPFVMIQPNGKFWIPPPLNREAALREEQAAVEREEQIRRQKEERRLISERKDFMTGRQLEQAKFGRAVAGSADGGAKLAEEELEEFNTLVKKRLCASREAICKAMAFCFDKSGAAKHISEMLKEVLIDDSPITSVDTRIARLFLLSDVLYNSQQPGVKNAFLYRNAIEAMAPEVFSSLGKHGNGTMSRMAMNKLRTAVGKVLTAWRNWSVYNSPFLDELHDRFEGREIAVKEEDSMVKSKAETNDEIPLSSDEDAPSEKEAEIIDRPQGDWTEVSDDVVEAKITTISEKPTETPDDDVDGDLLEEDDINGEELHESDLDGEPLEEDDIDGEPINDDDEVDS